MSETTKKFTTIAFDLDGTLAASKSPITPEMAELFCQLLDHYTVAIVSGGSFPQFQKQVLSYLNCPSKESLKKLSLFPTNGSALFVYEDDSWRAVYQELLSDDEKARILKAWDESLAKSGVSLPTPSYGPVMEDRGTQITFSACGQEAPIDAKAVWDPDQRKRIAIREILLPLLPGFSVSFGGMTSIDVTKEGIDKAYAMEKVFAHLNVTKDDVMFVGDKLEPGGNDYPARRAGVTCVPVAGPDETAQVIKKLIAEK